MEQTLTDEEFFDACGRLYDTLSLPEKNILLLKNDKKKLEIKSSYQFKVNIIL